jgi:hypothetical protein
MPRRQVITQGWCDLGRDLARRVARLACDQPGSERDRLEDGLEGLAAGEVSGTRSPIRLDDRFFSVTLRSQKAYEKWLGAG